MIIKLASLFIVLDFAFASIFVGLSLATTSAAAQEVSPVIKHFKDLINERNTLIGQYYGQIREAQTREWQTSQPRSLPNLDDYQSLFDLADNVEAKFERQFNDELMVGVYRNTISREDAKYALYLFQVALNEGFPLMTTVDYRSQNFWGVSHTTGTGLTSGTPFKKIHNQNLLKQSLDGIYWTVVHEPYRVIEIEKRQALVFELKLNLDLFIKNTSSANPQELLARLNVLVENRPEQAVSAESVARLRNLFLTLPLGTDAGKTLVKVLSTYSQMSVQILKDLINQANSTNDLAAKEAVVTVLEQNKELALQVLKDISIRDQLNRIADALQLSSTDSQLVASAKARVLVVSAQREGKKACGVLSNL